MKRRNVKLRWQDVAVYAAINTWPNRWLNAAFIAAHSPRLSEATVRKSIGVLLRSGVIKLKTVPIQYYQIQKRRDRRVQYYQRRLDITVSAIRGAGNHVTKQKPAVVSGLVVGKTKNDWLKTTEVMKLLAVKSRETVALLCQQGKLEWRWLNHQGESGSRLISRSSVNDWIAGRRNKYKKNGTRK